MAIDFNDRRKKTTSSSKSKSKKDNLECEVCRAGAKGYDEETPLYRHGGSVYCEQDLKRAINEGWHPGVKKITEIKR